jgi:hypothetical protein
MADVGRDAACAAAYAKFPAMAGVKPQVERKGARPVYVFTGLLPGPGGRTIRQVVRVTVDEAGRVTKVTASR